MSEVLRHGRIMLVLDPEAETVGDAAYISFEGETYDPVIVLMYGGNAPGTALALTRHEFDWLYVQGPLIRYARESVPGVPEPRAWLFSGQLNAVDAVNRNNRTYAPGSFWQSYGGATATADTTITGFLPAGSGNPSSIAREPNLQNIAVRPVIYGVSPIVNRYHRLRQTLEDRSVTSPQGWAVHWDSLGGAVDDEEEP